jgi:hypothetical protein
MGMNPSEEFIKRRKARALATVWVLLGFVAIIFALSWVKFHHGG